MARFSFRLPFKLLARLPVWLLARCKAVINHDEYREMVVGFPNPLAPGIQMHVSWGSRLGDGTMVKDVDQEKSSVAFGTAIGSTE